MILLYEYLVQTAIECPGLQEHLVVDLKHIKKKEKNELQEVWRNFRRKITRHYFMHMMVTVH